MNRTRCFAQVTLSVGIALGLALAAPAGAFAQGGDSGAIIGYVFDQTGNSALRREGDRLLAHPAGRQEGGLHERRRLSSASRSFSPAPSRCKAEAPKLQTDVQENIKVGINAPAEVNAGHGGGQHQGRGGEGRREGAGGQHQHRQRQGGLRRRHGRLDASRQPRRHLPAGHQLRRRRHPRRPHPRRRRPPRPSTRWTGSTCSPVPDREGLGRLRDPDRRLRRGERQRPRRRGEPGQPVGLQQVRVRAGRHRRPQQAAASSRTSGDPHHAAATFTSSTPPSPARSSRTSSGTRPTSSSCTARPAAIRTPSGILPDPLPELRYWYKGTITLSWQVTARSKLRSVTNFDEFWRVNTEGLGNDASAQGRTFQHKYLHGPDLGDRC